MSTIPAPYNPKNLEYQDNVLFTKGPNQTHNPIEVLNGTAWHTAAWNNPLGSGEITVEYVYRVDVAALKNKYNATRIAVVSANLKCAHSFGGAFEWAITNVKAYADGVLIGQNDLAPSGYPSWQVNSVPIVGADVTNSSELAFVVHVELGSGSLGWIDWYFGDLNLNLSVDTPYQYQNAYVACTIPNVTPDNVRVQIGDMTQLTDSSGVAGPFPLQNGSYTAQANATKDGASYVGSVGFTVPYTTMPLINLQAVFDPWNDIVNWLTKYWYVPVGVGAGVLVLLLLWPKSPITIISPQRER